MSNFTHPFLLFIPITIYVIYLIQYSQKDSRKSKDVLGAAEKKMSDDIERGVMSQEDADIKLEQLQEKLDEEKLLSQQKDLFWTLVTIVVLLAGVLIFALGGYFFITLIEAMFASS